MCVEALESRALLSAGGAISRPALAIAPAAASAHRAGTAGDPEYDGTVRGGFGTRGNEVQFLTQGTITCKTPKVKGGSAFAGGMSIFEGQATTVPVTPKANFMTLYTNGSADIINHAGTNKIFFTFHGLEHLNKVTLEGEAFTGNGVFQSPKGTFSATGKIKLLDGVVEMKLTIHVTRF